MKCGKCPKTDGMCYTSDPPKVKCTVTGKFHEYGDECDASIVFVDDVLDNGEFIPSKYDVCTNCIVCDESIELTKEEQLAMKYINYIPHIDSDTKGK